MDCCSNESNVAEPFYEQHHYCKFPISWFDLRVFYVRINNFHVDDSTPEFLTLTHTPLAPETLLEVNGSRTSVYSDGPTSLLRRDRADRKSEEATFVGTDSIRLTGSLKFEVFDNDDLILYGALDLRVDNCGSNVAIWNMSCEADGVSGNGFFRGSGDVMGPTVEVYVAGRFSGTPIVLTKIVQIGFRKRHARKKGMLDSIPENEETRKGQWDDDSSTGLHLQVGEYRDYKVGSVEREEEYSMYSRSQFDEMEDGELSWFNAGVRVGVGIGLGICLGVGIGVGLLVSTTRNFKRRLL